MDVSAISSLITDSPTQVNTKVIAEAPEIAIARLLQTAGQSLRLDALNAGNEQQQSNMTTQASTNQGIIQVYSADTSAAAGIATEPGEISPE